MFLLKASIESYLLLLPLMLHGSLATLKGARVAFENPISSRRESSSSLRAESQTII